MKKIIEMITAIALLICFAAVFGETASAQKKKRSFYIEATILTQAGIVSEFEKMLSETADACDRNYLMTYLAPAHFNVGDMEKAKNYAQTLLTQAEKLGENCHSGNAVHVGNLILGRIALAADDVAEAKRRLLEAGKTKGSPSLNSFGPNMRLAEELLVKNERAVVIEYFALCARFWDKEFSKLNDWKALVKKGGYPDFGGNLYYSLDPAVDNEMLEMIRKHLKKGNLTKPSVKTEKTL